MPYGRRSNEKIQGTRNEYHVVKQEEYDLYDGIHEAIISEDNFRLAAQKRKETGVKREKTHSLETVCLLSKLHEAKHHVNVKVDMDELDLTSAEAKATYKEIEEWVQEHYGFHVTNLNIAQVKQKHGIIERENYNKPKSENSRQPGCPEEKVKAIEDALRHFQMISDEF